MGVTSNGGAMIRTRILNLNNLDEKWRTCVWCGNTYDTDDDAVYAGGRLHPESNMVLYHGKWMCKWHFEWRFKKYFEDKQPINITEEDDS